LSSKRNGKKKVQVSGEVQLQFTLFDPSNPSASHQQILHKFGSIIQSSPGLGDEDDDQLEHVESGELEEDDEPDTAAEDELDENKKAEKKRKRLHIARLKKKATKRAYELGASGDVAGVLFIEISKITDLPPERNGKSNNMI
jgi:phosphatidylserine decarboxylase